MTCNLGDRQCATSGPPVAQVCGRDPTDALTLIDEPCPSSALCDSGRCVPGAGAMACSNQSDCTNGLVCVPLVTSAAMLSLTSYCVPAASAQAAAPGAACSEDSDCQSYVCLQHSQGRYCLQACAALQNCAANESCRSFDVTITGVQGSIMSCSPS
jgi:hypothetical protein